MCTSLRYSPCYDLGQEVSYEENPKQEKTAQKEKPEAKNLEST